MLPSLTWASSYTFGARSASEPTFGQQSYCARTGRRDERPRRGNWFAHTFPPEVERLWGAKAGTPEGDRLHMLATLIDAYEAEHVPMDPPDPIEAIPFRKGEPAFPAAEQQSYCAP
jgi:hypothetical protein